MSTTQSHQDQMPNGKRDDDWRKHVAPFGFVFGGLALMAALYMGYDYLQARSAPCESIFRQTAVALSTKIKFLKAEGELAIGRDKMAELSERAQMTALGLKTCCTALDAGRLDPEQFLQCKAKARGYEARIEDIVAAVSQAAPAAAEPTQAKANQTSKSKTTNTAPAPVNPQVNDKVNAAITISRELNQQVTKVRKQQVLENLDAIPPQHVDVSAQESEPNDTLLATNKLTLGAWVTGSIGASGDADYYSFSAPGPSRDWLTIEFQNRSAELEPQLKLFDEEKTQFAQPYKTSAGADLKYSFVAVPGSTYSFRVSNYYGKSKGVYLLRVQPVKAYDDFEPNDSILEAKTFSQGKSIGAKIMDKNDVDHFKLSGVKVSKSLVVKLQNKSSGLHPSVTAFDQNKNVIKTAYRTTPGADVDLRIPVQAEQDIFIKVEDYYKNGLGEYQLTAATED